MKKIMAALLLLLLVVVHLRCSGHPGAFRTHFWTSHTSGGPLYLFLDGRNLGVLPQRVAAPLCGSDSLLAETRYALLPTGHYELQIKNEQGQVQYTEQLSLKKSTGTTGISTSSEREGSGAKAVLQGDDCLMMELFY